MVKTYPRLTMGELTKDFERKWADYIGTSNSIFVNSGSANTSNGLCSYYKWKFIRWR